MWSDVMSQLNPISSPLGLNASERERILNFTWPSNIQTSEVGNSTNLKI